MAERAFLATAHSALRRMREDVVTTETVQDSSEDADYTVTNRVLALDRKRRVDALADLTDSYIRGQPRLYRPASRTRHQRHAPCYRLASADLRRVLSGHAQ